MTRHILTGDPDQITAFLLEQARADRPTSGARERALERVLAGLTTAGSVVIGSAAASASKLTASSLAAWALSGAALGVAAAGVIGGAAHWIGERPAHSPISRAVAVPTAPPRSSPAASRPTPSARREDSVPMRRAHSAERIELPATPLEPSATTSVPAAGAAIADFSGPASTELERELALLDEVRTNLAAKRLSFAELALARYEHEFTKGALLVEATALRVELLSALGRREAAHRLGLSFLARYPTSPSAARVRSLVNPLDNEKR